MKLPILRDNNYFTPFKICTICKTILDTKFIFFIVCKLLKPSYILPIAASCDLYISGNKSLSTKTLITKPSYYDKALIERHLSRPCLHPDCLLLAMGCSSWGWIWICLS